MAYVQAEDGYHYIEEGAVVATTAVPLAAVELPPVDPKLVKASEDAAEARRLVTQLQQQLGRQQAASPQQSAAPNMDDLNKQFYKEPVQSTVAIVQQGIADALRQHGQAGFDTLIQVARDKARAKNPELFDKYAEEIEVTVKTTVDPQFHTNLGVWENAANIAYGMHMSEIREAARAAQPATPAIRVSTGGPVAPGGHQAEAPKGSANKLSEAELAMAKNLGVDPESYSKGKEDYENQSTRGKSSWDGLITFDSRDQRRAERARRKAAGK